MKATSWDAPGNQSETTEKVIVRATPTPVFTGGEGGGGEEGDVIGTADMEVTVGNGWYGISQFNIPAPILYSASAKNQNTTAEIVGKAIGKGHNMSMKIHYTDGYIANKCGINIFCRLTTEKVRYVTESIDHVAVELFKSNGTYVDKTWNDSSDGDFTFTESLGGHLNVGDELKARVKIYGEFDAGGVVVDYRGVKGSEARKNKGLSSGWSNEVSIVKYEYTEEIFKAAYEITPHLIIGAYDAYNRFDYPYEMPAKVQEMYTREATGRWDPKFHYDYVQCVAFSHMVYNLAGRNIPTMPGNPVNWVDTDNNGNYFPQYTDDFDIYANGESKVAPSVGDFMVWDTGGGGSGHVAVIINVDLVTNTVTIAQSNTGNIFEQLKYKVDSSGVINFVTGNIPSHWLHQK